METKPLDDTSVIEATQNHFEDIVPIFMEAQAFHAEKFPDIFCPPDDMVGIYDYLKSFLPPRNPFRTQTRFCTIWLGPETVQGFLLYDIQKSSSIFYKEDVSSCFIHDIAIGEKFKRQGGASKLFDHLNKELDDLGNCVVSGQVWDGNDASEGLFEKYKFKALSHNYYRT